MSLQEQATHPNKERDPKLDVSGVGITFVDLLFAAVVSVQLSVLDSWWKITAVGWMQISVAVVLLLTSWIGYHTSANKPRWLITFSNLPLLVFLLDVGMVFIYGFAAVASQVGAKGAASGRIQLLPLAIAVGISFLLYVAWDSVSLVIKESGIYQTAWIDAHHKEGKASAKLSDVPNRRLVTVLCLALSVLLIVVASVIESSTTPISSDTAIVFDALLIIVLIVFRLLKETKLHGKENILLAEQPVPQ